MDNILNYISWRGDLNFEVSPFNEVDALILSQLVYLNFSGAVSDDYHSSISLEDLVKKIENENLLGEISQIPLAVNEETIPLLFRAASSARFAKVKLCCFVSKMDVNKEEQFAAVTFILDRKTAFISFRGTDGSIIGWKENFNMAFMVPVPSQNEAVNYVQNAVEKTSYRFYLGGHSKGGNLATYSAAFSGKKVFKRILGIYNNDGPGFDLSVINSSEFRSIVPLIKTYMPKSSVVGTIFEHSGMITYVDSSRRTGIHQHDPFSWAVAGNHFVEVPELTADSVLFDMTLKQWLNQLSHEQLEKFVDTLFDVLLATNAKTLDELSDNWLKKTGAAVKALSRIDNQTKEAVMVVLRLFFKSARKSVPYVL
ncbi:MAG: DUF2974 domain-containing protein [Spirochaetaceae bacterium]|nr:DUF2974 domain-containing protein [Spirochaetaceae bacterium]MBP5329956.1 DUF2974 domain-containing protein [Spirochaetaceae bacterium]